MGFINYIKNIFGKNDIARQIKEDLSKIDLRNAGVVDYREVIPITNYTIDEKLDEALKKDC